MTTSLFASTALPDALNAQFQHNWQAYVDAAANARLELPAALSQHTELPLVWACSEFISRSCIRQPGLLKDLIDSGDLGRRYAVDEYRRQLKADLEDCPDETALAQRLRRRRQREMVRIAWRDLAGLAELDETLADLSALADACIDSALTMLMAWQLEQRGTPWGRHSDCAQQLVVLGMGKLGARELNFSSDVDLIFAFAESGETRDTQRPVSNEQFFISLGQKLIAALNQNTADGFVFRIDMRLRPYGDSGPLVMSFDAMEDYYQSQGRDWERYALIKARPVAGDMQQGEQLLKRLRPFIYRRYLDYGTFEALRDMKAMIDREVTRKDMQNNIKLGPGGIREIEFIGQLFQLIRGGRQTELQQREIQVILGLLAQFKLVPDYVAGDLLKAYVFLRRTENRLQAFADEQTHILPTAQLRQQQLALAMGFEDYAAFLSGLDRQRQRVSSHFEQIFAAPQQGGESSGDSEQQEFTGLWHEHGDEASLLQQLTAAGFTDAAEALRRLRLLREGYACRALSARGRERLDRLMPLMLAAVAKSRHPDSTLMRLLGLIESIARRTVYLSLLVEHPLALSQLVKLCDASPWLTTLLSQHPLLLDQLLDPRSLYAPLEKESMRELLALQLANIDKDDLEQQLDVLRQFKQAQVLHVAAADLMETIPLMVVSDYLTAIAEVVLEQVLAIVAQQQSSAARDHFAIIAYGKLGGIELGYGSDLDLVFLHEETPAGEINFTRFAQRIIHLITARTPAGILYEVDMRLRPSGASGLLVSSLNAFHDYQQHEAWTWEHQALIRARVVAGNEAMTARFEAIRREILGQPRDGEALRHDVVTMRQRMRQELEKKNAQQFDLKQGQGGITDVEFIVQYCVLNWAARHPELLQWSDNIRLLKTLAKAGILSDHDARLLTDAYCAYRGRVHRLTLQDRPAMVPDDELQEYRTEVCRIWSRLLGD